MKLMDPTEKIQRTVADRIRMRRQALNLSQADLAKMLQGQGVKIHQSAITKIESGERKIELSLAMQIAQALDMNWGEFFVKEESLSDDALLEQIAETTSKLAVTTHQIREAEEVWEFFAEFELRNLSHEIYERIRSESLPRVGPYADIAYAASRAESIILRVVEVIQEEIDELEDHTRSLRALTEKVRNSDSA